MDVCPLLSIFVEVELGPCRGVGRNVRERVWLAFRLPAMQESHGIRNAVRTVIREQVKLGPKILDMFSAIRESAITGNIGTCLEISNCVH